MKKLTATISVLLVLVMALSAPASAIAIITSDTFSTSAKSADKWVTDRYDPEEFDRSDGKLYLSVGPKGYYKYRSDDKRTNTTPSRVRSSRSKCPRATPGPQP